MIVVLAASVAIAAMALAVWWLNSLNGLPDFGDPLDVAAFRALSIPDDQNALALWRRANQMLTVAPLNSEMEDPRLREWVEANRPAVELFLKAAECPDAMSEPPDAGEPYWYPIEGVSPGWLIGLTNLEGERPGPAAIRPARGTAIAPSSA